jgi:hypothetical protein
MDAIEFGILALWVVSACLFGAAFTMLGPRPEDYRRAKSFFVVAGGLFGVTGIMWGLESTSPTLVRLLVVGCMGAISFVSIVEGLRFTSGRESISPETTTVETSTEKNTPLEKVNKSPDITLRFIYPKSPALVLDNKSDYIATQIKWTVVLWNLDDPRKYSKPTDTPADSHEPLQIPVQIFDFIRPKTSGGPQNLFDSDLVHPFVKKGDRLIGSASVDCPDCLRGHTFFVSIVFGEGGWYYEEETTVSGQVLIPRVLTKESVLKYIEDITQKIPEQKRVAISDPK